MSGELYSPPDAESANALFGAMCGHGALAAALGIKVEEACHHFAVPARDKPWVNIPDMKAALECAKVRHASTAQQWPTKGLVLIQFEGPWTQPGVPPAAACRHTHWVATNGANVWDINLGFWIDRLAGWERWLPLEMYPKRCTGWSVKRGFEVYGR